MESAPWPAHNLELMPYNFHVFGLLQKILKGHTLILDEYVKEAVAQWLKQQSKEFFSDVICWLQQCGSCLNSSGDLL